MKRAFLAILFAATLAHGRWEMNVAAEVTEVGESFEIVKVTHDGRLVVVTDPLAHQLFLFQVADWTHPNPSPIDLNTNEAGIQGVPFDGEPTSVAFHPDLPLAFVTVLGQTVQDTGTLRVVDLRPGRQGTVLLRQTLGQNPDSVAVSPDGRWLIVANEAEEDPETRGSIDVLDLRGLTDLPAGPLASLPSYRLDDLAALIPQPPGSIEPEFVAFDPQSRFAAVTCQENDAVVFVDLQGGAPAVRGVLHLTEGSEPDGISVLDEVADSRGVKGCLIAVAEEGREVAGRLGGQHATFAWVDPRQLVEGARIVARVDVRPLVDATEPAKERSPEGVELRRWKGHDLAFVGVEKGDHLLAFDLAEPTKPVLIGTAHVGDRPEGVTSHVTTDAVWILTGDEGKADDGKPGHLTVTRLTETHEP